MLLLREEPTDMREYEADAALLASLVGIVFEVHGLFANPINDENEEHCFEFLGRLFTIDHDLLALDLIMKPVSYTHLDVYKRQRRVFLRGSVP